MPHRPFIPALGALALALACAGSASLAADKNDVSRVTPVPADQPIPVSDFLRPALMQRPEPNESGTHLAALIPLSAEKMGLMVVDLRALDATPLAVALPREYTVDEFEWISDDRILFRIREERRVLGTYVALVSKGLNNYAVVEGASIKLVGVPLERKHRPLLMVVSDITDGQGRKGHVIDVDTNIDLSGSGDPAFAGASWEAKRARNDRRIVTTYPDLGNVMELDFLPNEAGELAFARSQEDGIGKVYTFQKNEWKLCPVNCEETEVVSYGSRPGELVVLGPRREGKARSLQFMDAPAGTLGDLIFEDPGYDFAPASGRIVRDPRTRKILGLWTDRATPASVWFSEQYQSVQKFLEGNFANKVVRAWPVDKSGASIFFQVYSDRQPATFYVANLEKKTVAPIKSSAPWIDPERMRPTSMMKFKTAEGMKLDAYVTLPAGASKEKPVPLVVLPHSGQWGRDTWGYNPTVQLLASRGYAVLQPNYRGSAGTAWMFPYEEKFAYRKMHDDVAAATRAVLKTGLFDPARVAIVGWNFGGYLAMCGVAFEPDLYRCAAAVDGIYDWANFVQEQWPSRLDADVYDVYTRWIGPTKSDIYDIISPNRHMGARRAPVFVGYEKEGPPNLVTQSKLLIDALKKGSADVEVVSDTGLMERWGFFNDKVELHEKMLEFLAKHLAPGR